MTDVKASKTVPRYTQPVIQVQPGPEFRTAEVPLFEDPKGKWVKYEDIQHLLPTVETSGWRPVETADITKLFATSTWVLIHTSDGRVTEGMPHFFDGGKWCWIAARGKNCTGSEPSMLVDRVTHWQPRPAPPGLPLEPSCICEHGPNGPPSLRRHLQPWEHEFACPRYQVPEKAT